MLACLQPGSGLTSRLGMDDINCQGSNLNTERSPHSPTPTPRHDSDPSASFYQHKHPDTLNLQQQNKASCPFKSGQSGQQPAHPNLLTLLPTHSQVSILEVAVFKASVGLQDLGFCVTMPRRSSADFEWSEGRAGQSLARKRRYHLRPEGSRIKPQQSEKTKT